MAAPTWVHRRGAPAASSALLPAAVAELDLPTEPGVAYVAGEARDYLDYVRTPRNGYAGVEIPLDDGLDLAIRH